MCDENSIVNGELVRGNLCTLRQLGRKFSPKIFYMLYGTKLNLKNFFFMFASKKLTPST